MLKPVKRQLVVDDVFTQMRDMILENKFAAGAQFPAERELSESLQVNRNVVREALKKLEQMRLITIQQGERTTVTDFRRDAGLDLLPSLVVTPDRGVDFLAVRSLMEMRLVVCRDVAFLASRRRTESQLATLRATVAEMARTEELPVLEGLVDRFWSDLIDASQNIAYRMAFNSLARTYEFVRPAVSQILAPETRNLKAYRKLLKALAGRNPEEAAQAVEAMLLAGNKLMLDALKALQPPPQGEAT